VEISLFVALWHAAAVLSFDYCNPPRPCPVGRGTPLVAMFEMSVPKILLIEDVRLVGFALAGTI
jgi:hypothetical protein